jgi:hypothetical protein
MELPKETNQEIYDIILDYAIEFDGEAKRIANLAANDIIHFLNSVKDKTIENTIQNVIELDKAMADLKRIVSDIAD